MATELFVPPDAERVTAIYEEQGLGGACGPCAIAAIAGKTVTSIIAMWPPITGTAYPGYCQRRVERIIMSELGFRSKQVPGKRSGYGWPDLQPGARALASVTWRNPDRADGRWGHWTEKIGHSHTVALLVDGGDRFWIYCNGENAWLPPLDHRIADYMTAGQMTSYLALTEDGADGD